MEMLRTYFGWADGEAQVDAIHDAIMSGAARAGANGEGGPVIAGSVTYDNATSGLTATNVKAALDELQANKTTEAYVDAAVAAVSFTSAQISYSNVNSTLAATNVKTALDELDAEKATYAYVDDQIAGVGGTPTASSVSYDNTTSGLVATDVQAAVDEVVAQLNAIPTSYDASAIAYDNTATSITGNTVQQALTELDSDLAGHTHSGFASDTHTHSEYAQTVHSHNEYSALGHTHSEYAAQLINTDGDTGKQIYVGAVDPSSTYTMVAGDVWLAPA